MPRSRLMRIMLDESVPGRLGALLSGHLVSSVQKRGWAGIKNGKLVGLAALEFDAIRIETTRRGRAQYAVQEF